MFLKPPENYITNIHLTFFLGIILSYLHQPQLCIILESIYLNYSAIANHCNMHICNPLLKQATASFKKVINISSHSLASSL